MRLLCKRETLRNVKSSNRASGGEDTAAAAAAAAAAVVVVEDGEGVCSTADAGTPTAIPTAVLVVLVSNDPSTRAWPR